MGISPIERESHGRDGVPGLKDIPLIGALFGSHSNTSDRTELLVTITPHVINTQDEAKTASEELRSRLKNARGVLQELGR